MLTLPAPQFVFDTPSNPPELEKPINLRVAAIRYPDGQVVVQDNIVKVGTFVYRSLGRAEEIWNEADQRWMVPPGDVGALSGWMPLPLSFKENDPMPWQGVLVAIGQKDRVGATRFQKASGGAPAYRLRAFAQTKRDGVKQHGLSAPSADLLFVSAVENQRFSLALDTGNARDCTQVRLMLKDSGLVQAGYIEIRTSAGREIEIANCAPGGSVKSRIVLQDNGDIRLEPAAGRTVVLDGTLDVGHINYRTMHQQP